MTKQNDTANDICSSIRSSDTVDPFEGLDLSDICVSPDHLQTTKPADDNVTPNKELFDLNPLDGIDLKDISVDSDAISSSQVKNTPKLPFQKTSQEGDIDFVLMPQDDDTVKANAEKQKYQRPNRSLSNDIARPPATLRKTSVHPVIEKAYHYAELAQIWQKISFSLEATGGKTILVASPLDNTGSSLLAAALAYNAASSCQQNVLLIDCNMRRAGLHDFFFLPQSYGFTDLIKNNLPWQAVVKKTGTPGLSIITTGDLVDNFSEHLRYAHIPNLMQDIRNEYDLIIFDTSPILRPNRNNVNIVSLTAVTDYFLLVTKQAGTTKDQLKETKDIVEAGNGKIDGIVINEHSPASKPTPYKK
jgi:Mrp family chromosome partitioning ATPase